jgi:hypothetical protein
MDEQPQVGMSAMPKKTFKKAIDTILLKKDQNNDL